MTIVKIENAMAAYYSIGAIEEYINERIKKIERRIEEGHINNRHYNPDKVDMHVLDELIKLRKTFDEYQKDEGFQK
jgi:hypothetical protein